MNPQGNTYRKNPTPMRIVAGTFVLVVLLLAACSDDGGTGPEGLTISDLAGSWEGTQYAVISVDNPDISFDLIEDGGTVLMTVEPSGSFTGTVGIPGSRIGIPDLGLVTFPISGLWRLDGQDQMRIEFIPQIPPIFTSMDPFFELDGNTITIWDETTDFDFDGNGQSAAANFVGVMVRR